MVVSARDGHEVSSVPREQPFTATSFGIDPESRRVAGLSRRFESSEPTVLRVWDADDYLRASAVLQLRTMTAARFWPGRAEILVTGARANGEYEILAVADAGTTRSLLRSDQPLHLAAAAPDGGSLVIDRGVTHELILYRIAASGLIEERKIARPSPQVEFIGWVAVR